MKALILNSGVGCRMSDLTEDSPKCLVDLVSGESILSRQLRQLQSAGVSEIIMTTGYMAENVENTCAPFAGDMRFSFVENPDYRVTNYIYSIYLARERLSGEILMLHGDLVLDDRIINDITAKPHSCMTVSHTRPLPEKDFKAVIKDGKIISVGVHNFDNSIYAQPLYRLRQSDWEIWLAGIERFCEKGNTGCYAEDALNELTDEIKLYPYDIGMRLCMEVDTPDDLNAVNAELSPTQNL